MPRIAVFQHVAVEPLGTFDALIRARGHRIRFHNFERDPEAQPSIDRYRGLVVLGGPMNVEDQHRRPHLKTELLAIERALAQGKPVLGICLGAQLLAHVLGAPVRRHERPGDRLVRLVPEPATRRPGLRARRADARVPVARLYVRPAGGRCVHLARTDSCEQQAFRFGDKAYGFPVSPGSRRGGDRALDRARIVPCGAFAGLRASLDR
jgi:GMP synthase (glutamine-hydrolysing)